MNYMLKCLLIVFVSMTFVRTNVFAETNWTLKDIELLVKQKSYQEALSHITSIPPTQRNAQWNKLFA
ncbi:MAG: hypothetical protein KDD48_08970, partial [Bdellovibrionales bacterium]|nr:hypothetical protein [Bdellovibrionales bacterium]